MTAFLPAAVPFSSSVQFFGVQQPNVGAAFSIIQQEFAHDIVQLSLYAQDVGADSYASGMPMVMTFGRPLVQRTFYGYVNHASRQNTTLAGASWQDRNMVNLVCVGASFWMKESGTLTFRGGTAAQAVQQIATQFGLAADVVDDGTIWPVLHMAGMTYWEFCCMLARRIGYTFYCSGIQLVFKPRNTDPTQLKGLVQYYDYRNNPFALPVFVPTIGANNPTGGQLANRILTGIDPRTSQVVTASMAGNPATSTLGVSSDTPLFDKTEHFTVRNQGEATVKVAGAGQSNQLYLTATASGGGDPMLAQGSLVYVTNVNGSQNGLWYITKCEQTMTATQFLMDMELGRDSMGVTAVVTGVPQAASLPQAKLVQNLWVAAA